MVGSASSRRLWLVWVRSKIDILVCTETHHSALLSYLVLIMKYVLILASAFTLASVAAHAQDAPTYWGPGYEPPWEPNPTTQPEAPQASPLDHDPSSTPLAEPTPDALPGPVMRLPTRPLKLPPLGYPAACPWPTPRGMRCTPDGLVRG
jgi:hypothetical protein